MIAKVKLRFLPNPNLTKRRVLWHHRDETAFGCCTGNTYRPEWRDKRCVPCPSKPNGPTNSVSNLRGYYCEKGKEDVAGEPPESKIPMHNERIKAWVDLHQSTLFEFHSISCTLYAVTFHTFSLICNNSNKSINIMWVLSFFLVWKWLFYNQSSSVWVPARITVREEIVARYREALRDDQSKGYTGN